MEFKVKYIDNVFHIVSGDIAYQYEQIFNCRFNYKGFIGELQRDRLYKSDDVKLERPADTMWIVGRERQGYLNKRSFTEGDVVELLDPENIILEGQFWGHLYFIEDEDTAYYKLPPNK